MKHIVIIGGGTGTYTLLSGLKKYPVNLSVIMSTADDGGSTGILRKKLGVVPPGDIRQCLVGLSQASEKLKQFFSYRFDQGPLEGHPFGNLYLAGLELETGDIRKAILQAKKLLKVKGEILPVTLKPTVLSAIYANGKRVISEHKIDQPSIKYQVSSIKELYLKPSVQANPDALSAIKSADLIVFGPGDLYTSILPNILVSGIRKAINKSRAKKIFIISLMTKHGQTDGFLASDFVKEFQKYLKNRIDYVVVNTQKPQRKQLLAYRARAGGFVRPDVSAISRLGVKTIAKPLISEYLYQPSPGDKLKRSFLRHNSLKLAKIIYDLAKS
jgi:uncharacterized cofD-like protein